VTKTLARRDVVCVDAPDVQPGMTDDHRVAMDGGGAGFRALIYAGKPLGEPVAARGHFVMNTAAELNAAFAEYRAQGARVGP
jgi:redox-sensitive bicupin YhaK (pirin superfamily)